MATNAWIQYNIYLTREGLFQGQIKSKKIHDTKNLSETVKTITFGEWLDEKCHNVPEIHYPNNK